MKYWKIIILSGILNFCIWCLPLAIITKIYTGYAFVGCLMGLLCFYVVGPYYNIGEYIINKIM